MKCIYLDYAATSPVDPRAIERMVECLGPDGAFGNASATRHAFGRQARALVEQARVEVATLIGAEPSSIIWTSGATESNNLALIGASRFYAGRGRHIVSARTEHKAVLDALAELEREGFEVTYLRPDATGIVHPEQVIAALRPETILVSLMHVNNEIGVVQDIASVGKACRERGVLFHVDAAQSAGKVPIDVRASAVDLMSLTAHKLCGPKGIGALFVRQRPAVGLRPLLHGGGQERGLRSGTLATHQIVGMGAAFSIAREEAAAESIRVSELRQRLWAGLDALGGVELNGHPTARVPGILNVSFHGVEGESLLLGLAELAVSAGSACATGSDEASYVLRALGRSDQLAQSSIRFSVGRFTTASEIDQAVAIVTREVQRLRSIVPGEP